ncbi:hypothetical protein OCU04_013224, partial [Sclerotinia nivalis]
YSDDINKKSFDILWRACKAPRGSSPKQQSNNTQGWEVYPFGHELCNDPSAGSPTETLLRLLLPLNDQVWITFRLWVGVATLPKAVRKPHLAIQSVVATGGVHSSLKSNNCNALSPARQSLTRLPRPFGQGEKLVGSVSVARVRPRTSKGITAELYQSLESDTQEASAYKTYSSRHPFGWD